MSRKEYVFVLRDHGQDICDECLLRGDSDLESWENFVNGEWTTDPPILPGWYPVIYSGGGRGVHQGLDTPDRARLCNWCASPSALIVKRWSLPYPFPSEKEEKDA